MNIDLNRDFPDTGSAFHDDPTIFSNVTYFNSNNFKQDYNVSSSSTNSTESEMLQKFYSENLLDFAINFHDGAQVVNYPLDSWTFPGSGNYSKSPDDSLFVEISKSYANFFGDKTSACALEFPSGITNGADWYSIKGGMQDYSYIKYGTLHLTLEVSCIKFPSPKDLKPIIENHQKSLLEYLIHITHLNVVHGQRVGYSDKQLVFKKNEGSEENKAVLTTFTDSAGFYRKILSDTGVWRVFEEDKFVGVFNAGLVSF